MPAWLKDFSISFDYSARLLSVFCNAFREKIVLNAVTDLVDGVALDSFRLLQIFDPQVSAFHLTLL